MFASIGLCELRGKKYPETDPSFDVLAAVLERLVILKHQALCPPHRLLRAEVVYKVGDDTGRKRGFQTT